MDLNDRKPDNSLDKNQENEQEQQQNEKITGSSSSLKAELMSWLQILVTAACIAFVLNTFIIANSRVPSGSMENTIMTNDRVIGFRLSYLFSDPARGDVVIFRYPVDESIYYVKRIIGMPGDTVDIVDGKVYLNGSETPLDEPYLREEMEIEMPMHFEVPEDSYFMMGDNRNYSADSRYWTKENITKDGTKEYIPIPYVKRKKIIAKVLFRYWPLNKIGAIH